MNRTSRGGALMGAVLCFPTLTLLGAPRLTHQRVSNRVRSERPNPVTTIFSPFFLLAGQHKSSSNSCQWPAVLSGFFVLERGVVCELCLKLDICFLIILQLFSVPQHLSCLVGPRHLFWDMDLDFLKLLRCIWMAALTMMDMHPATGA